MIDSRAILTPSSDDPAALLFRALSSIVDALAPGAVPRELLEDARAAMRAYAGAGVLAEGWAPGALRVQPSGWHDEAITVTSGELQAALGVMAGDSPEHARLAVVAQAYVTMLETRLDETRFAADLFVCPALKRAGAPAAAVEVQERIHALCAVRGKRHPLTVRVPRVKQPTVQHPLVLGSASVGPAAGS